MLRGGTTQLAPGGLQLVTTRDVRFAEPGVSVELGLHYGVQYWRSSSSVAS